MILCRKGIVLCFGTGFDSETSCFDAGNDIQRGEPESGASALGERKNFYATPWSHDLQSGLNSNSVACRSKPHALNSLGRDTAALAAPRSGLRVRSPRKFRRRSGFVVDLNDNDRGVLHAYLACSELFLKRQQRKIRKLFILDKPQGVDKGESSAEDIR